ncbi:MAG: RuBisCO large subunit C-terminal-like domain-containing protein [Candidatus Latescibacterota bacterium]|jgi:ribulose 1,5-bisphosphate carboxylase large subunit-like protein
MAPVDEMLATYYLETDGDLARVAREVIVLETTGGWDGPGPAPSLFDRCTGRVVEVREERPGAGTVTVAFPLENFNLEESAFASAWLSMVGGGTHALLAYRKSRLVDFALPERALAAFPGPRFGIEGTRRLLGLEDGMPVVGTIVKPTAGLTPDEVADLCFRLASGGVRFIKDDEKMLNPAYCPLQERVRQVAAVLQRAEDRTGQRVLYAPHVTTSPWNLGRFAETAIRAGASALMINFFAAGFQSLEFLRREFELPIYAHCGGKEAFGREPGQGVSPEVVGRFSRLLGGDYFRTGVIGGYLVGGSREELDSLTAALTGPMGKVPAAAPVLSGGLKPANLAENLRAFGCDVLALAGTGLTRHPKGIGVAVEEMLTIAAQVAAEQGGRG